MIHHNEKTHQDLLDLDGIFFMEQGLFPQRILHGGHQLVVGQRPTAGEGDDTLGIHDDGHGEVALSAQRGVVRAVSPIVGVLGEENGCIGYIRDDNGCDFFNEL